MRHGIHHLHKRKRIHKLHQLYPHPDPKIKLLDQIVLVVAFVFPLTTIPQVIKIWNEHAAAGLSLTTWILYTILSVPMLLYGIVHKAKPIIIMNILWLIVYSAVIFGTVIYS